LERLSQKKLNAEVTRKKLRRIALATERNKSLGFRGRVFKVGEPEVVTDEESSQEVYRYAAVVRVEKPAARNPETARAQFEHVLGVLTRCAGGEGWKVVDGKEAGTDTPLFWRPPERRPEFVVPALTPDVMATYFHGIYERDEHIRVIHAAVENYVATLAAWKKDNSVEVARGHVLLKGKPAGCKTTILERLKKWYESACPGAERMTFVDAQTTTRAGLENWLLDKAEQGELADIVVFEELEKQQPLDGLLPLVSVMGSGYIAKLNALVGHRKQLANILVFATCNDEGVIRSWRNGAIWSRFAKKLHCPRPSKELMRRILLDTVTRVGGDPAWAERALEFAYEVMPQVVGHPMDDPREIKGLLDGRDRLLDGTYQRDLLTILQAERDEVRADRQRRRAESARVGR
jgi:hypothetical protein